MDIFTFAIATFAGLFGFWLNLVFWPPVQRFGVLRKNVQEQLDILEGHFLEGGQGSSSESCLALNALAEEVATSLGNLSGMYWRYLEFRKQDPAQAVVELRALDPGDARRPMLERITRIRSLLGLRARD